MMKKGGKQMFKKSIIIFLIILFVPISYAQEKIYKKPNVKEEDAQRETGRAILSTGLSMPAIGNDPCQGVEKTMGGLIKYKPKGAAEFTGLPSKPSASVGRQGQVMEGGTSEGTQSFSAENVSYEGYDRDGIKCVEATANPDGTTTFKNTSDKSCIIQVGDRHTLSLAPKSEITTNTQKNENNPLSEGLGKVRSWLSDQLPDWLKPDPSPPRGRAGGVRGNCDPEGIAGGCRVIAGSGVVLPTLPEYLDTMAKWEKEGLATKLRWSRINPSPDSAVPSGGPSPTKTYPSQATKSGYEKEKASKTDKNTPIINPSEGSTSGSSGRSFDFCGRNLPTPEQAAAMGFDPRRIIDPPKPDWTGRIEQRGIDRTITWSKNIYSDKGKFKVEYTYKEGKLVAINYEFYDKHRNKIGNAFYDGKNGVVEAKRFR